jgi:hypothetical protein
MICSLHLDLARPAAGDRLIVSNPRRSQSMVPRYNRQWLRPRHQLVRAQGRRIMPPARRLRCVLGPSLPKKSAPERASPLRLTFSFHTSHHPPQNNNIGGVLTLCRGCHIDQTLKRGPLPALRPAKENPSFPAGVQRCRPSRVSPYRSTYARPCRPSLF